MRRKLLGKEHEFWLKENYSRYENPVLATKLTEMVQKSHEKEYEELVRMLPSLSDLKLIESVSERILFLSKPVTISVANVKAAARRLNCPRKKLGLISTLRSRSAKSRHIRRWAYKAIEVDKPFQWFRTLKLRKSYAVKFSGVRKMQNFLEYLAIWNKNEGIAKNMVLVAEPFKKELLVRVRTKVYININEL